MAEHHDERAAMITIRGKQRDNMSPSQAVAELQQLDSWVRLYTKTSPMHFATLTNQQYGGIRCSIPAASQVKAENVRAYADLLRQASDIMALANAKVIVG